MDRLCREAVVLDPQPGLSDDGTMGEAFEERGRKYILRPTIVRLISTHLFKLHQRDAQFGREEGSHWDPCRSGDFVLAFIPLVTQSVVQGSTLSEAIGQWSLQMQRVLPGDVTSIRDDIVLSMLPHCHSAPKIF